MEINRIMQIIQGFKTKTLLTLSPGPGSLTQFITRVNLLIKIWLQSLN